MNQLLEILSSAAPAKLLADWHASGRLATLLPEVALLYGVPQRAEHHPEIDTLVHIGLCLEAAAAMGASPAARFAVLVHDLGKGLTDPQKWPAHIDHESTGVPLVEAVCARYGLPADWTSLAVAVCRLHLKAHRSLEFTPQAILRLLQEAGLVGDVARQEDFLTACEADARGRLGKENDAYRQGQYLRQCAAVQAEHHALEPEKTELRAWETWHKSRLNAIKAVRRSFMPETPAAC